jgi:hypothetical protein
VAGKTLLLHLCYVGANIESQLFEERYEIQRPDKGSLHRWAGSVDHDSSPSTM